MTKADSKPKREVRLIEMRAVVPSVEADPEEKGMILEGRAIVYDSPTVMFEMDGMKYYEVIARGALDDADLSDVPFKYNHCDAVMIMARTRNKTLSLTVDKQGLFIRAELADITASRDLYTLVRRGDIDKMSFAFTTSESSYNRDTRTRTITKFKRIWDVSAVDIPAYSDTELSARSFFKAEAEKERKALEDAELRKKLIARTFL